MGRGGDDFHSPEMQLGACRGAMDSGGLTEVEVVGDDIDQTGRTFDRKGIARIKTLVEGGHIGALVFYDINRFGRNALEGLKFAKWLDERGVRLVSASQNIDTSTPAGRLMFTQFLAFGEYQSDEIGRYWAGVIRRRAQAGLAHRAPRGYRRVKKLDVPDPDWYPIVAEAFRKYARGERSRDICAWWHTRTGHALRPHHLKRTLRNPFYHGIVELNGEQYPGQHKPLVDEQTWQKVQDRLAREHGLPPATMTYRWSMTGLAFCPKGHAVKSNGPVTHSPIEGNKALVCGRRSVLGGTIADCPGIGSMSSSRVLKVVLDRVAIYMRELRLDVSAQSEAAIRHASAGSEVAALRAQLTKIRGAMVRLTTTHALEETPEDVYRASMAELKAAEAGAAQALREAEQASTVRAPLETASLAQALLDDWPEMTEPERNRALGGLIRRVVLRPKSHPGEKLNDRIMIDWL